ncbi:MAG: RluA family pseudouridine synthase [Cytophagales bacterium]
MKLDNIQEADDIESKEEDSLYEHHRIVADKGQTLIRVDKFLVDRLPNVTRNRVQNAIDAETIQVNGKSVKVSYKVKPFDIITIVLSTPPRNEEILPENIPLDITFEDDHFLIVNKKPGMVVHPAYGNWTGTLVNALVYHMKNLPTHKNGEIRPGLVHRIDKDTSGLLVIAKSELAMTFLAKQFFDHTIERTYYALVWGVPKENSGVIKTYLGRSVNDRKVTAVYEDPEKGKIAITHYKLLKSYDYVSLIQCNLETGRTHQIRAHMKHLGHPLFSDEMYGGTRIVKGPQTGRFKQFIENCFELMPRQALHAKTLGFKHPSTKKWVQFDTELPEDFQLVINRFERHNTDVVAYQ